MPSLRLSLAAMTAALLLLAYAPVTPVLASVGTSVTECGQFVDYLAPDPAGPTDGTITLGHLPQRTIDAAAAISAAVMTQLPTMVSGSPTCLVIALDGTGRVTALDFAAQGTTVGTVLYDTPDDAFVFADRLTLPTFVTDLYPGLKALFATSAASGSTLTLTFFVDIATGAITGFDGTTTLCGSGAVASNGDGLVGSAVIPAVVLDATATARLAGAGPRPVCAKVRSIGTDPGTGALLITTTVKVSVGVIVTPPPTSTAPPAVTSATQDAVVWPLLILVFAGSLALAIPPAGRRGRDWDLVAAQPESAALLLGDGVRGGHRLATECADAQAKESLRGR